MSFLRNWGRRWVVRRNMAIRMRRDALGIEGRRYLTREIRDQSI